MLVVMQPKASERDVNYVVRRAKSLGLKAHLSHQNGHTVIGLSGNVQGLNLQALSGLHGVEEVRQTAQAYRLASREFKSDPTLVTIRDMVVGERRLAICAGPCSVESRDQVLRLADVVREAGGQLLRGGAFKPRSSPYSFQGLAEAGLEYLARAREATGLAVVTEVLSSEQVPLVSRYADVLQIGCRNMQNYALLHAAGESKMPVLLKRGMSSSLEELLLSAEYILSHGNPNVILCERGIRTFETYTRNTLDINAVPSLQELTHLPVLVDPSHATGRASLVKAVSRAGVAAGADGLIIEIHDDPEHAWSDGFQSLTPAAFRQLMIEVRRVAEAVDRSV